MAEKKEEVKRFVTDKKRKKPPVDLDPKVPQGKEPITEGFDSGRLDQLIKDGLGDSDKLPMYRRALSDPESSVKSWQLRPFVAEVCEELIELVTKDTMIYNKLRSELQRRKRIRESREVIGNVIEAAVNLRRARDDK